MGACSSAASAAVAAPKVAGPQNMTLRLKINCTNGCGPAVCSEVKSGLAASLSKETNGAVQIRGGISENYNMGMTSTDYTFNVPLQVDCNKLIADNAGGGKAANFATNAMDMVGAKKQIIASQIQSKVSAVLGNKLASAAGGMAAELVSCSVS
eukprot:TRINITY_DN2080_c0_g1_i1.p2 TRINITY_DN2080_c0_g1~~TRINITY_DN2080_c0_g1_i1.p2  ORF type:complete len:153 (-),score=36.66 TRINITY_DN2080_c0_g1_i1:449-907(-)